MICVFPEDETLSFLEPIVNDLSKFIDVFKLTTNNKDEIISKIESLAKDSIIIFIGHGASRCLYGAVEKGDKQIFINSSNIGILRDKNICAISCRSSEFLDANKSIVNNYLGFGNIPTEWDEIAAGRDVGDPFYLEGINERELRYYVSCFKKSTHYCLGAFVKHKSIKQLYFDYRLCFNKSIYNLMKNKQRYNHVKLSELIIDTKNEIDAKY